MASGSDEKTYPLHKIIRQRNVHKMKILLPSIRDINAKNKLGYPPLVYACEQEQNDEMLQLLFKEREINPLATDNEGQIALHVLAFKGSLSWIKKFFERFPDVPVDTETKEKNTPLIMAAKMDHVDIIKYLLKKGAQINHENSKGFTALHYTANNGYPKSTGCLIEHGAFVDVRDNRGNTPLMKCCSWDFLEVCRILLSNDADIDAKDAIGNTALAIAARRGFCDIVRFLLEYGANVNTVSKGQYATFTPLVSACLGNNVEIVEILIAKGADVNYPGGYSQALFNCIKSDFYEGVIKLINARASLYGRHPQSKKAPLEMARRMKRDRIVKLIESHL